MFSEATQNRRKLLWTLLLFQSFTVQFTHFRKWVSGLLLELVLWTFVLEVLQNGQIVLQITCFCPRIQYYTHAHTHQQHNTHKHLTSPRAPARPTMGIHGAHFKNKVRWEASYLSFYKTIAWERTMETLGESVNLMIFPHWTSSDCLDLDKLPTPLHNGTRQLLYPAGL